MSCSTKDGALVVETTFVAVEAEPELGGRGALDPFLAMSRPPLLLAGPAFFAGFGGSPVEVVAVVVVVE
jgi:hypothetical protein